MRLKMKKNLKVFFAVIISIVFISVIAVPGLASENNNVSQTAMEEVITKNEETSKDSILGDKAISAAIVVGIAAAAGAAAMGWAIARSVDGIARQPEAEGKIRTTLMLGLVFVETAIIYALVVAILIIFVL